MIQPGTLSKPDVAAFFAGALYVVSADPEVLARAIEDGVTIIQLRDKTGSTDQLRAKAAQVQAHPGRKNVLFILNDNPELALEVGADGIHIGQDTDTAAVRRAVGPAFVLGKTTHKLEQARQAVSDGADYISAGPVYPTPTKPGRPAVGLGYVREVAESIPLPFVAIGGIDSTNIDGVIAAGARTIGIVRAAAQAPEFLKKVTRHADQT